jgi:hypothetical protein
MITLTINRDKPRYILNGRTYHCNNKKDGFDYFFLFQKNIKEV